ncbi:MAG TPA: phosphoribosylformylglycinamidine synthase I [Phycisphaerae bacterium]|nr:phosphoribosylformylglycinamidine synthase I [Phycisphaerae bacterium]
MASVRVLVLRAAGINCDEETALAWEMAGGHPQRIHVRRLVEQPGLLDEFQILTIPGGFSYGDDIASGKILAGMLMHHAGERIRQFIDRGGLVLGICNGFQVLVRTGLLPGADCPVRATLTLNDSGHYEDRWVRLRAERSCPFLEAGDEFDLPVAHAEGKIMIEGGDQNLAEFEAAGRVALRYQSTDGMPPGYPENPNGSIGNAAGLIDRTGRVLGLMPHPERAMLSTQFPIHLRDHSTETSGLRIFQRAINACR